MYTQSMRESNQQGSEATLVRSRRRQGSRAGNIYPRGAKLAEGGTGAQTELRWMANQLLSVQESERKRIASDLHDGLGQSLTIMQLALAESEKLLEKGAVGEVSESLRQLRCRVRDAMQEMRHVAMNLRPPMLDDLGILPTLSWFFREFEQACQGVRVEKDFSLHESNIPARLKITIFRIIQEATNNIVKYANADLIRVNLKQNGDALHFSIEDNGDGFDPDEVAIRNGSDRGLGLLSMKDRATISGGEYTMDSISGQGTRICICWPFDKLSDAA